MNCFEVTLVCRNNERVRDTCHVYSGKTDYLRDRRKEHIIMHSHKSLIQLSQFCGSDMTVPSLSANPKTPSMVISSGVQSEKSC